MRLPPTAEDIAERKRTGRPQPRYDWEKLEQSRAAMVKVLSMRFQPVNTPADLYERHPGLREEVEAARRAQDEASEEATQKFKAQVERNKDRSLDERIAGLRDIDADRDPGPDEDELHRMQAARRGAKAGLPAEESDEKTG